VARVLIADDSNHPHIEVRTDDDGVTTAWCTGCLRHVGSHRPYGPVSDHIEAAKIHVDNEHEE
jgi:hypothetical protein